MTYSDRQRKGYNPSRIYNYRLISMDASNNYFMNQMYSIESYEIISKDLEELHETLPLKIQADLNQGKILNHEFQLFISLCWFCWGGMNIKAQGLRDWFRKPVIMHDYYLNFTIRILTALRSFDRSKGNWASCVKFARLGAVTMTMRDHMKIRRNMRLFVQLDDNTNKECTWEDVENELNIASKAQII